MDPNVTLSIVREQLNAFHAIGDSDIYADIDYDVVILTDAVAALDEWLTKGGCLPSDWASK